MDKLYSFIPKKTLVLITLLIVVIIVLVLILFYRQNRTAITPSPLPVISQSPIKLSPLQKTIIGETTVSGVERNYQINTRQILPNGDLEYSINSKIEARPDQIIFHNNLAQFERVVIVGNPSVSGGMKLSDQILKYGPAEKIIKGSKFYGYHMNTYIYAAKGFAFVANTNADEVYEVQTFTPTSLDNYLSSYGADIKQYPVIKEGI